MSSKDNHTEPQPVDLRSYLSRRLRPLVAGIALLISFGFPASYCLIGYGNLRHSASVYAESFAEKLKGVVLADQALWKYQTYKYTKIRDDFFAAREVMQLRVLDELGQVIAGFWQVDGEEPPAWNSAAPIGHAAINFNNRTVGTVEVSLPIGPLLRVTALLFLISSIVGAGLATLVYLFPLRVVRRMEGDIRGLISNVEEARNESDRLRMAAQASESRFREFVQGLDAIVWEADAATWRFSFVSQQAEKILGYPVSQWLAEPRFPLERIHAEDRERVLACYQLAILEESGFQLEYRLFAAEGREVWIQDFVRLSRDEGSGSAQMSGIMVDITERKRGEQVLAAQARDLSRSNAELEQFAYVASHDLQEPLRMVSSYVQLIARRYQGRLDREGDEFIAFAVEGATRMQRLIRDLLTYSRVGTRGHDFQPVDCMLPLRHALTNLQLAIRESGAIVSFIDLPTVLGDATQLTQLFQNLVGNAIKFRDSHPLQVQVGAKLVGYEWRFWVRDNGMGIATEYFDRIFLIFQRLQGRTRDAGTGIGLAVCKKIVERHGGRIWVESAPDKGAIFYFTIPMLKRGGP
ncbi:MAG: ATP-binding protein [Geobacteraceae bacterium]|nr:ATP-binding protein [Geobacteraceae bacterium]